jgi:hypothetical protein
MLLLACKLTQTAHRPPWYKGKLVGPKPPFKLQGIWAIRIRLDLEPRVRELAMFNLAIDSKLRMTSPVPWWCKTRRNSLSALTSAECKYPETVSFWFFPGARESTLGVRTGKRAITKAEIYCPALRHAPV